MKLNEIVFKTKVGNYFWVVTSYKGKGKSKTKGCGFLGIPDIYHTVAHREIYHGPMGGVGDYDGTSITSDEDIEGRHLEMCAIYKKRLEKGGEWEGQDRPLAEQYPFCKKKIERAKKKQDALGV